MTEEEVRIPLFAHLHYDPRVINHALIHNPVNDQENTVIYLIFLTFHGTLTAMFSSTKRDS